MRKSLAFFTALLFSTSAIAQYGAVQTGPNAPGQLIGARTSDNAGPGNVGEYISSTVDQGSAISLANATPTTFTSIRLTPGDWDIEIDGIFTPAGTTTLNTLVTSISTVNNGLNQTSGFFGQLGFPATTTGGNNMVIKAGPTRVSINIPTDYFAVVYAQFGTAGISAWGTMRARRVR